MNKNVPKLRFKEFEDEWRKEKLGNLFEFKNGVNADKEAYGKGVKFINVLDILNNNYIDYNNIVGLVDIDEKILDKYAVNYGDVLFQRSSETREEVGTANVYLGDKTVTFGGFVIRGKKIAEYNPSFMNSLLKSSSSRKEIVTKSGGSTRYNVGQEILSDVNTSLPSLQEQEKIADFFTILDSLIEEQDGKVSDLELYKKGMMQKIFSQEIRFKDENGCDYPEWEEDRLNHLFKITAGGDIKKEHVSEHKNKIYEYPIYANSLVEKGLYGYSDTYKIEGDSITVTGRGSLGYAIARYEKYYPIVRLLVLKPLDIEKYDAKFFEAAINNIKIFVESTGVPQLTAPQIGNIQVKYPSIEEQNKIAEFLTNIDNLIEEEKKNLDDLREMKKGLLQQMFI